MSRSIPPRRAPTLREHPAAATGEHQAFTLIELLVVIAVILILAALVMPVATKSIREATKVTCKSNLGQIGKGNFSYAGNNDHFLPCYGDWYPKHTGDDARLISPPWAVLPYLVDREIYVCPADETPDDPWWWQPNHFDLTRSSYMWNEHIMTTSEYPDWRNPNGWARPLGTIPNPKETGLIADGWAMPNGWTWRTCIPPWRWPEGETGSSRIDWEHDGTVNMLYLDQRVESITHRQILNGEVRSRPRD